MCEFLINKENISNMLINISVTGKLLSVQVHLTVKPKRFQRVLLHWSAIFQVTRTQDTHTSHSGIQNLLSEVR